MSASEELAVVTAAHCPTCTCAQEVEPEHSCEFCEINLYHPKCPENAEAAAAERCPHCGNDRQDYTMHAEGCPTIDTCAQTEPGLPRPWHTDDDWLKGERFTTERWRQHLAEAHS